MPTAALPRILLVDDNPAIHQDYLKILRATAAPDETLDIARTALFGDAPRNATANRTLYELDFAHQGEQALAMVVRAATEECPYTIAFVDMHMPPGWDGTRTIAELWKVDADLQVVLCTAHVDQAWERLLSALGNSDRLLILRKPFDAIEVRQLAASLSARWQLTRDARDQMQRLQLAGRERTREIEAARAEVERRFSDASRTSLRLETTLCELSAAHVKAAAAQRTKSEFLANISHEIRTPMTAILGYADFLRDASLSHDDRLRHLAVIRRNGAHLLSIVNDLLDISRIETGNMTLERVSVAPCAVLGEVASLMRVRATEKHLDFAIHYEGKVPERIHSDPRRLRQVLLNLVGNAVKFTAHGGVRILVRTDVAAECMQFDVIDSGIGISSEQHAQLFAAFSQVDGTATREHGGTGLGLAISQRLAQMLGGGIQVDSALGRGSKFSLRVSTGPLDGVRMLDPASEAIAASSAAEQVPGAGLPLRLLLAEDGRDNQILISFYLRKAGADVTIAADGERALAFALEAFRAGKPFDVILMDMQMPGIDGYEVTRRLREAGYDSPIVALTAHAMDGDRAACLGAGCDEYLTKPVERDALVRVCASVAHAAPAQDPSSHFLGA